MRSFTLFTSLLALVGNTLSAPAPSTSKVFEKLNSVPQGWTEVRPAAAFKRLHFRIALEQANPALFEQTLLDVSTPSHPQYGYVVILSVFECIGINFDNRLHLKRNEVKELIKPSAESTKTVLAWLEAAGIPPADIEDDGDWINFYATVKTVESMLDTKFSVYRNSINKIERIRTLQYSVPDDVAEHIVMIAPTIKFPRVHPQRSTVLITEVSQSQNSSTNGTSCARNITPACLRDLYHINDNNTKSCGTLGVSGYLEECTSSHLPSPINFYP
jgi:tripeptidyl-peptidase-1